MTTINVPKKLAFYYSYPSLVNGSAGNIALAVAVFSAYDQVVFGAGLEETSHPDHANTVSIINDPAMTNTEVYGYVNAVDTLDVTQGKIDKWESMGVKGIFVDQFGYDYGVSREKQREIVWCIQNKSGGLKAFVNAWNPDDAFSSAVNATYNPSGLATRLGSNDYYLAESFAVINGAYDDSDLDSNNVKDWQDKAVKMAGYRTTYGTKMATVATLGSATFAQGLVDYSYFATVLNNFDAYSFGEEFYSASSASLPFRTRKTFYGTKFDSAVTITGNLYERQTNVGINLNTNSHTTDIIISF